MNRPEPRGVGRGDESPYIRLARKSYNQAVSFHRRAAEQVIEAEREITCFSSCVVPRRLRVSARARSIPAFDLEIGTEVELRDTMPE